MKLLLFFLLTLLLCLSAKKRHFKDILSVKTQMIVLRAALSAIKKHWLAQNVQNRSSSERMDIALTLYVLREDFSIQNGNIARVVLMGVLNVILLIIALRK